MRPSRATPCLCPTAGRRAKIFAGGDTGTLYDSLMRVLALPDEMRLFICRDYGLGGRAIAWETTVGAQKRDIIHIRDGVTREPYVELREARDAHLQMPKLIVLSLQVNMRAGTVPTDDNGDPLLKVPLNKLI